MALVVSLMLLTTITLLSVTAMRGANLDTRIAVNHQHKQISFQSSENALSRLLALPPSDMQTLKVPGKVGDSKTNCSFVTFQSPAQDNAAVNDNAVSVTDLELTLMEVSRPGQYKFSGFGLNSIAVIYNADAWGRVEGTGAMAHNRMGVALIR